MERNELSLIKSGIDFEKLFQLAEEAKVADQLEEEFYELKRILKSDFEVKSFLESPENTSDQKEELIKKFFPASSEIFKETVNFLIKVGKIDEVIRLSERFSRLVAERKNKLFGEVVTAIPLTEQFIERLNKLFRKVKQKEVSLKNTVDTKILGGCLIKITGGEIIDATLRRQLLDCRDEIIRQME